MQISVFKDLLKSKEVPFIVPIEKVVNRIKLGKSKDLIERIRNGEDLKKQLPCILFAGEFSERNSNGLITHSGLMVVDYDKYPDNVSMNGHLEELKKNKHFCLLFISPIGNGIKGVVRIPIATKDTHPKFFKAFYKKFLDNCVTTRKEHLTIQLGTVALKGFLVSFQLNVSDPQTSFGNFTMFSEIEAILCF